MVMFTYEVCKSSLPSSLRDARLVAPPRVHHRSVGRLAMAKCRCRRRLDFSNRRPRDRKFCSGRFKGLFGVPLCAELLRGVYLVHARQAYAHDNGGGNFRLVDRAPSKRRDRLYLPVQRASLFLDRKHRKRNSEIVSADWRGTETHYDPGTAVGRRWRDHRRLGGHRACAHLGERARLYRRQPRHQRWLFD